MGDAVWLSYSLPQWYFQTIIAPFSAGPLTMIPAFGIVCLAVGVVWGAIKRRTGLLIFLTLVAASHALVVVAGFMRGDLTNDAVSQPILLAFLVLQIAAAGFFIVRLKGARLPAAALSVFTSTYAFYAAFIASMSFSDVWL